MQHEKFHYQSLQDVKETMGRLGVSFPLSREYKSPGRTLYRGRTYCSEPYCDSAHGGKR